MIRSLLVRRVWLGLPLTLVFSGCGDGVDTTPSTPTSAATPTPVATATATPSPTADPSVKSCSLPPLPNCSTASGPYEFGCCTERNIESAEAAFLTAIQEAQDFVASTRSELFSSGKVKSGSERTYTAAVVKRITELNGICAAAPPFLPEDEVTLKSRQDRGEIFDIIQGDGSPRLKFVTLCLPSIF